MTALRAPVWILASLWLPFGASAHPGNLDQNGGHYAGMSYHCHLTPCDMPDTFTRIGRDSVFMNPRDRERFFNIDDWDFEQDYDGDCQSTRQEMLVLTSRIPVSYTNPRNCVVRTGEWIDEYTGETYSVATQLDVDHIIPLIYAHSYGGDRWPPEKKLAFANDPMNILLVERREIRRKNNRGPSRYLPREDYQCQYARAWQGLAEKYDLDLDRRDETAVRRLLESCGEGSGVSNQDTQD